MITVAGSWVVTATSQGITLPEVVDANIHDDDITCALEQAP